MADASTACEATRGIVCAGRKQQANASGTASTILLAGIFSELTDMISLKMEIKPT